MVAAMMIIMMGTWMKKIWGKSLLFTIKNWIQSKLIFIAISLYHTRKKNLLKFLQQNLWINNESMFPDVQLKENWNQNQNKQTEKIWSKKWFFPMTYGPIIKRLLLLFCLFVACFSCCWWWYFCWYANFYWWDWLKILTRNVMIKKIVEYYLVVV